MPRSFPPSRTNCRTRDTPDCPPTGFRTSLCSARGTAQWVIHRTGGHTVDSASLVVGADLVVIAGDLIQARVSTLLRRARHRFPGRGSTLFLRLGSARGGCPLPRPRAGDRARRTLAKSAGGSKRNPAAVAVAQGPVAHCLEDVIAKRRAGFQGTGPRKTRCRGGGSIASSGFTTRPEFGFLKPHRYPCPEHGSCPSRNARSVPVLIMTSFRPCDRYPGEAVQRPQSDRNRYRGINDLSLAATSSRASASTTATKMVSSPATVPTTPAGMRLSSARATPCASPAGVLSTSR